MKPTVLTFIYSPNEQTRIMEESCKRFFPLVNAGEGKKYTGNGDVFKHLYNAMTELSDVEHLIYSDGGDTIFLKDFTPLQSMLIYSVEKACWPLPQILPLYPECPTPWKFLNGGNWSGPRELVMEFHRKYITPYIFRADIDGQSQQSIGFLKALQDGFPIRLDYSCVYYQSMAFEHDEDFTYTDTEVINNITGTRPAVIHYNGRTDPAKGIQLYKNQINGLL